MQLTESHIHAAGLSQRTMEEMESGSHWKRPAIDEDHTNWKASILLQKKTILEQLETFMSSLVKLYP